MGLLMNGVQDISLPWVGYRKISMEREADRTDIDGLSALSIGTMGTAQQGAAGSLGFL
jgi:hypothetical protein